MKFRNPAAVPSSCLQQSSSRLAHQGKKSQKSDLTTFGGFDILIKESVLFWAGQPIATRMVGVRARRDSAHGGTIHAAYKLREHLPGYTGFIPKLQNSFAQTYTASTRITMSCPPTPDIETVDYDFTAGRRSLRTASPVLGMLPAKIK
jgi:hypothetical protein